MSTAVRILYQIEYHLDEDQILEKLISSTGRLYYIAILQAADIGCINHNILFLSSRPSHVSWPAC